MIALALGPLMLVAAQTPASLSVFDQTLGGPGASGAVDAFLGHAVTIAVGGDPGELALVVFSPGPAPASPPSFGGVPVVVDPAGAFPLALGPLDAQGRLDVALTVPPGLPPGLALQLQALLVAPTLALRITPGVAATLASEPLVTVAQQTKTQHPAGTQLGSAALVVDNQADWNAFWDLHDGPSVTTAPPPVDFQTLVVVAAFTGRYPSGGAQLTVDHVVFFGSTLKVVSTLSVPGPGCGTTFGETSPVHFVAVPRAVNAPVAAIAVQIVPKPPCP